MELPEAIRTVRDCIVKVRTDGSSGTGFFVNEDAVIATAEHVVGDAQQVMIGMAMETTEHARANYYFTPASVIARDSENDLALTRMLSNPFTEMRSSGIVVAGQPLEWLYGLPMIDADRPEDGEQIAISGYPFDNPTLVTNTGAIASAWHLQEQHQEPGEPYRPMLEKYLADVEVNSGNSGGPVYRVSDGKVVGVCIATMSAEIHDQHGDRLEAPDRRRFYYSSGLTLVTPMGMLLTMLEQSG